MDIKQAIYTRQSVSKVQPNPLDRAEIEELLSAAVQAPNHYRNRPWRFVVLSGSAREELGKVMAQSLLKRSPDASPEQLEAERKRPLRAPVLIVVGIDKPENERVSEVENICAGAAAVENLLLLAHAKGLGAMWRTGPAAVDPAVKTHLGFEEDQHLIAMVYIGHPETAREVPERPSYEDRTRWLGEWEADQEK